MKIHVVPGASLTDAHVECWLQLLEANPELDSPFFHPLYTREAAAVLDGVEVAVLEENGETAGFFPFQRTARNVGIPVGGSLNDFQGVVARPRFTFDATALVHGCRLSGLRFTQLLSSQTAFQPYHWLTHDSPSLDLRAGFDAYCRQRRAAGSTFLMRTRDKRRFAIRDVGPLRFEALADDPHVLESLIAWKWRQYEGICTFNLLAKPGILEFLKRLLALRNGDFQGVLSALYFGGQLAAVHLGLRYRDVLHLWFPTYNKALGKYSPGNIYFLEQAAAADALGIRRIDLGWGHEDFKASLRSCGTTVAEGGVGLGAISASVQRSWVYTKHWVQMSPFRGVARRVARGMRGAFLYGRL